jgi:hypothetical protein
MALRRCGVGVRGQGSLFGPQNRGKTMTVKQLIDHLKKMPPDDLVGWADHDQNEEELNGRVRIVEEASAEVRRLYRVGVVLRP